MATTTPPTPQQSRVQSNEKATSSVKGKDVSPSLALSEVDSKKSKQAQIEKKQH